MAAGLGTRLRPLTYEVPKPMVPVGNRPVLELILRLLAKQGFTEVISNLHWFPDTIRDRIGDGSALGVDLTYSHEEELLGTAGGVRNVRDYFGSRAVRRDGRRRADRRGPYGAGRRPRGARRARDAGGQAREGHAASTG